MYGGFTEDCAKKHICCGDDGTAFLMLDKHGVFTKQDQPFIQLSYNSYLTWQYPRANIKRCKYFEIVKTNSVTDNPLAERNSNIGIQ